MEPTFRLLRVRGIPVGAHWTWPVAFAIVAWTLARSVFPSAYPGLDGGTHLLMAVATAGLLFASVVAHEVAHAVTARREGMPVEGVVLWILGGVSDVGGRARSAGQELRVAASGPALSLVLACVFAGGAAGGGRLGWPEAVHGVFEQVARLNVLVAAFNLIPALPLDGGRILRAWLWRRQRDLLAATRSAARAGQAFAVTLIVVGVLDVWGDAGVVGVWLMVLGGFLLRAASSELEDARTRHELAPLTAGDVMASDPGVVLNDTSVARLVEHPPAPERSGYPVLGGGRLLGVVALASARSVPSADRATRRVEDVMTPLDDIPMVDAADPILDVLERLDGSNPIGQVVVIADGCVVGLLDEDDIALALDRAAAAVGALAAPDRTDGVQVAGAPADGRKAGARVWVVVTALCLVTAAALYRPPLVVLAPGAVTDVTAEVAVTGVPVTEVNGRYVVPRLEARRTSVLGAVIAAVRDGRRVVSLDRARDLNDWLDDGPDDWVNADRHPGLSRETRILAAAAAARSQGLPVKVTGTGAQVVAVRPGSPADGVLRPGDVVVAIDGDLVTQARPLAELLRQRAPGGSVRLSLDRAGRVEEATVVRSRESEGGIGIALETRDLAVELPFEVRFSDGGAGGRPESGLAYALAIADMISSSDLAGGRTIAAAGLLDDDGHVGPARETAAQAESAARARAALFVVAQDDAAAAPRDGLQVTGVDTLARALEALSTTV